jgi:hypothetical protein
MREENEDMSDEDELMSEEDELMSEEDEFQLLDDNTPLAALLMPSCLHSAEEFAIERSCAEARDLVASTYKPIVFPPPKDPQERIWNGFTSLGSDVDTKSAIAWPENIRVDLSRDVLYLGVLNVTEFQSLFKIPHLDLPRVLKETRRLAIPVNAFIQYQFYEEKDSTRGNSMVDPKDREYETFDDMEANIPQSIELLRKFESVTEVILSMCAACHLSADLSYEVGMSKRGKWGDWGLVSCSLSSLPTTAPPEDPANRVHRLRDASYLNANNVWVDQRIQLTAFRMRSIVQALEKEKEKGRLGQVEKIRLAEVVFNSGPGFYNPGWHHCCKATGERFNPFLVLEDQDLRFI